MAIPFHVGLQYCSPYWRGLFLPATRDEAAANLLEEYADFLESHVEPAKLPRKGLWSRGIAASLQEFSRGHVDNPNPAEDPNSGSLRNQTIRRAPRLISCKRIVDAGFLNWFVTA